MKLKSFECPDTSLIYEYSELAEAYIAKNKDEEVFVMSEAEVQVMLDEGTIAFNEEDILAEGGKKDKEMDEKDDVDGDEDEDKEGTSDEDDLEESDDEDEDDLEESDDEDEDDLDESDDEDEDEDDMDESCDDDEEMEEALVLDISANLSEQDKKALFSNGLISEEYAETAQVIFESAIKDRVEENTQVIIEHYNSLLENKVEKIKASMTDDVNDYLEYVVSEWLKENEIAIESSLKVEMNEAFIEQLSEAFKGHFIKVPEERYDILEGLADKVESLEEQLDSQLGTNARQLAEIKALEIAAETSNLCEGLSLESSEKFKSLVENISYDDVEEFKTKALQLKESYFKSSGAGPAAEKENGDDIIPVNEETPLSWIDRASQI